MKKSIKILLITLAVVIALLSVAVYCNWNSISAFIDSFRYSQDEVENKLEENKEFLDSYLAEESGITVRDLTDEEFAALNDGTLSEDDVVELLVGKTDTATPQASSPPDNSDNSRNATQAEQTPKPTPTPPEVEEANKKVAEAVARLYIQKSKYLNKLDDIEAQVRSEFVDMYKQTEEMQSDKGAYKSAKNKFLTEYLPTVATWEKECDSVVYAIIDEIRAALKEAGQGQEVADKLESAYLNEKKLKKTYFIRRYMD